MLNKPPLSLQWTPVISSFVQTMIFFSNAYDCAVLFKLSIWKLLLYRPKLMQHFIQVGELFLSFYYSNGACAIRLAWGPFSYQSFHDHHLTIMHSLMLTNLYTPWKLTTGNLSVLVCVCVCVVRVSSTKRTSSSEYRRNLYAATFLPRWVKRNIEKAKCKLIQLRYL